MWRLSYPGAPRRCYRCGHADHIIGDCRRQALPMRQVEKMPDVGEVLQEVNPDKEGHTNFQSSFAAVVKSAKFIELEAEQARETERLQQVKQARKVQEERWQGEEKADREAAKQAVEARKKVETEEKRTANLARLTAASKEAEEYKEKVRCLHKRAQNNVRESRDLEDRLGEINEGEGTSKRP